jgi:hypothetical protein
MDSNQMIWRGIKVFSTVLIAGAIGREVLDLVAHQAVLSLPPPIAVLGRLAIAAHGVEGAIAAWFAPSRGKSPLRFAIYTFFVGTLGLVELLGEGGEVEPRRHEEHKG